ncbi:hypothetical protein [Acinetobacter seifertii]|uniref:hypothetical protein n=1 Tax=Acinetobacter seifertii TaxID=1530123 RepID=UPI001250BB7E|nr:hypothetical protein [Acinetobacter seifertii]
MSLSCPFCHSTNVILVEASTQQSNTTLTNLVTPTTLGALGTTVAKSFNLPPEPYRVCRRLFYLS